MKNRILYVGVGVASLALFVESLHVLGIGQVVEGIERLGSGFVVILLLSLIRDAGRAFAWTRTVKEPARLSFLEALRARLAGEALNTLLPMGMVIGEPAKALYVSGVVPFPTAAKALALEFAFYIASLVLLFAVGFAAFATQRGYPGIPSLAFALLATTAVVAFLSRRSPLQKVMRHRHLGTILACESVYQLLSVVEVYFTLLLVSPERPTVASAIVLETVSRAITILFKVVPMRIGVDEASSSFFATQVSLSPATGLTLALVRKLRLLAWGAVGLALLARRPVARPSEARARRFLTSATALLTVLLMATTATAQTLGTVTGSVSIAAQDGAPLLMPGVTVTLSCEGAEPKTEVSDDRGQFRFERLTPASRPCSLVADLEGFKSAAADVIISDREIPVNLQLGLNTLQEAVVVRARPGDADPDSSGGRVERITTEILQTAPTASDRFQDALPLIPGVVRGPDGLLNINGTRSNQNALTFNSANGTDPVTGDGAIELPIDAVRSVQVRGAAYAPEFGLSAGAVTSIETHSAGDRWDVTVNDLEPRLRRRGGQFRGIESWTPRLTVGGPVRKNRLGLLESVQYEYSQTRVFGLPPLQSDTKIESLESFTRADVTVTPSNHVAGSLILSPRKVTYAGLNTFNPQSVTSNIRNHNVLGSATDQILVGSKGVFDTRVSVKEYDFTIYPSVDSGPMVLAPDQNSGSYFNDQDRTSRRVEWFNTYSFTPHGPSHLVKIGAGVSYESFDGVSTSRPVEIVRENGTRSQEIAFVGTGKLGKSRTALQGYAQDTWAITSRLTVLYGARYDSDSLTGDVNLAPRGSVTLVVSGDGRTVVHGGAGLFYSSLPLNVSSFEQQQRRIVTVFAADGMTPVSAPIELANVVGSPLRALRGTNWSVDVDREVLKDLFVRVGYQQRQNRFEPMVDGTDSAIVLRTDGRSRYREGQISGRYVFRGSDQIVASYTRSSAVGSLNDFNTFYGNIANPVIRADERGPLPWDVPNRVLMWASITLPRGFAVFPVIDARTGFPLSNLDADRNFVGPRNAVGRFPRFVSLDAQVTKKLRVLKHNATIGLKIFNITDHFNPRDYQGNLASRNFGGFDNSVGRTFRGKWVFEF